MEGFQKLCCLKLTEKRTFRKTLDVVLYVMDTVLIIHLSKAIEHTTAGAKGNVKYRLG